LGTLKADAWFYGKWQNPGEGCQVLLCPSEVAQKGAARVGEGGMSVLMTWFASGCWMRARALQGGDLRAFQCRIFSVRSAGVRQPPLPAWARASRSQLAGRKGLLR